ncbi:MAG: hypothetical protein KKH98_05995 [Spirochaetes bacterium]|nr:hypothetical protein [Spirochaetota bacterium]
MRLTLFLVLLAALILPSYLFPYTHGSEEIVNYEKYGRFVNRGTPNFRYLIKNIKGLRKAIGPGIFPDFDGIKTDSDYIEAEINGKLEGYLWDFTDKKRDYKINFFKWASTPAESLGVKLFYVGYALEKGGFIKEAIRAYYALLIHHPKAVSYTYWHSPIYLGRVMIDRINILTRMNPQLGIKLKGAKISMEKIFDNDVKNDKYTYIDPGKLVKVKPEDVVDKPVSLSAYKVIETRGGKKASVKKYNNGHWQLFVDGDPFFIKGMVYSPNQIGKSPDYGTLVVHKDWQIIDLNNDGMNDVFFQSYVDKNKNDEKDKDEPRVGDAKLMKDMGVNTLRLYHHCFNKKLFRKLHKEYGFHILLGDYLGCYAVGSGANWHQGTDYSDPDQRKSMKKSVSQMVQEYKDEPYVLMWVLGNENNFGHANNAMDQPEPYYEFVNEVARMIHKMDPSRPVAICNGEVLYLDVFAMKCPDVDIFGINSYRGNLGFGESLWKSVKDIVGRPIVITEYGCSAYAAKMKEEEAEIGQMDYHKGNWEDIWYNRGGSGQGNSIGGVVFEWLDEWWKAGTGTDPNIHDTQPQFGLPFLDGWSYEEWLGIASQGDGSGSPHLRQLRKAYYYYKKVWNK